MVVAQTRTGRGSMWIRVLIFVVAIFSCVPSVSGQKGWRTQTHEREFKFEMPGTPNFTRREEADRTKAYGSYDFWRGELQGHGSLSVCFRVRPETLSRIAQFS